MLTKAVFTGPVKTVMLWNKRQSWSFSIITSVFSVTWSFRNSSNLLFKWNYYHCQKNSL